MALSAGISAEAVAVAFNEKNLFRKILRIIFTN
jgi:hypothetical protein